MPPRTNPRKPPDEPIGEDELGVALEKAGYALEIEVAEDFLTARMATTNGLRFLVGEGQWKDVDVRAVAPYKSADGALRVSGRVITLIQVKRLHRPSWFVGILGHAPPDDVNVFARGRVAGSPSFGCGADEDNALFSEEGGLLHAFEGFLALPVCAHWAIAERNGAGDVRADAQRPYFEDLHTLAVARDIAERRASLRMRRSSQSPLMITILLTLVVDTPDLYLLDPFTKALSKVPMLSVLQSFDGPNGPVQAMIDVVARRACSDYARKVCEVRDRLRDYARGREKVMVEVASQARQKQRQRDNEQGFEEYATRAGILGE